MTASSRHAVLKAATADAHRRLDDLMSSHDLGHAASYEAFLSIHHGALSILVLHCGAHDRPEFEDLLACLRADLGTMPATRSADVVRSKPPGPAESLGVAYVLRGSRLGAAFLRKRVGTGLPARYLNQPSSESWPAFLERLEAQTSAADNDDIEAIVSAARHAFDVFLAAARRHDVPLASGSSRPGLLATTDRTPGVHGAGGPGMNRPPDRTPATRSTRFADASPHHPSPIHFAGR